MRELFESKIEKLPDAPGCWLWTGGLTTNGYGTTRVGGRTVYAHRLVYEHFKGPLGDKHVLHRCDVPSCCNPEHLFAGTQKDNGMDASAKRRFPQQHRTHCPSGHLYDAYYAGSQFNRPYRFCSTCRREGKIRSRHARQVVTQ